MSLLFISSLSSSAGSAMLLLGQSHNTCGATVVSRKVYVIYRL